MIEVPWHLPTAAQGYGNMQVMCTDQLLFTFNKSQGWHDLYQAATGGQAGMKHKAPPHHNTMSHYSLAQRHHSWEIPHILGQLASIRCRDA